MNRDIKATDRYRELKESIDLPRDLIPMITEYSAEIIYVPIGDFNKLNHEEGRLYFPRGISVINNMIYVADSGNYRIPIFNLEGKYRKDLIRKISPIGVTQINDKIYVSTYDKILVLNMDGNILHQWGSYGSNDGQINNASNITAKNDLIYVSDYHNNRVQIFNQEGKHLKTMSNIKGPVGVSILENKIYISESGNRLIRVFDENSELIHEWGDISLNGQFNRPSYITTTENEIYVTDFGDSCVKVFDHRGIYMRKIINIRDPYDIAVKQNRIYVGEHTKSNIRIFEERIQYD